MPGSIRLRDCDSQPSGRLESGLPLHDLELLEKFVISAPRCSCIYGDGQQELLLRPILESYISRSPSRPGGWPAFCRHWHGTVHDPSKGFPHETAHCPRIRFGSGSRHDRLLLYALLQLPLRLRRRLWTGWLRRPGRRDFDVGLRAGLFDLRRLLMRNR